MRSLSSRETRIRQERAKENRIKCKHRFIEGVCIYCGAT